MKRAPASLKPAKKVPTVKKTVSMRGDILAHGQARAVAAQRNFSSYVASLIAADRVNGNGKAAR